MVSCVGWIFPFVLIYSGWISDRVYFKDVQIRNLKYFKIFNDYNLFVLPYLCFWFEYLLPTIFLFEKDSGSLWFVVLFYIIKLQYGFHSLHYHIVFKNHARVIFKKNQIYLSNCSSAGIFKVFPLFSDEALFFYLEILISVILVEIHWVHIMVLACSKIFISSSCIHVIWTDLYFKHILENFLF